MLAASATTVTITSGGPPVGEGEGEGDGGVGFAGVPPLLPPHAGRAAIRKTAMMRRMPLGLSLNPFMSPRFEQSTCRGRGLLAQALRHGCPGRALTALVTRYASRKGDAAPQLPRRERVRYTSGLVKMRVSR